MSMAMNKTIEIVTDALNIFAKEDKGKEVAPTDVHLWIGTKDEEKCTPYFWVCKNGVPHMRVRAIEGPPPNQEETCEVTWDQLRGVKFDIIGRQLYKPGAESFLAITIKRFAQELKIDPRYIGIQIIGFMQAREGKAPKLVPVPFLYDLSDENQAGYQLSWEKHIFSDENEIEMVKNMNVGASTGSATASATASATEATGETEHENNGASTALRDPQGDGSATNEPVTRNPQPEETDIRN